MTVKYETRTDRIRAKILSGELVHPPSLAQAEGATGSLGGVIIGDLKVLGYRFDRVVDGNGFARFRCVNPDYVVTEADRRRLRDSKAPYQKQYRDKVAESQLADEVAPPGETAYERKKRMNRLYKRRQHAKKKAELERIRMAETTADSRQAIATLEAADRAPQPAAREIDFSDFNGAGIIGVQGFGADGTINYQTKLDGQPPTLGQGLQVFAMALLDNGVMRLGVQSGDRRWVADVVAEIER